MKKTVLKFDHVTARLRDRWIFPETNWEILAGEHWAVLGPNGSGKSSLMRLILGDIPAVQGWIIRSYDREKFRLGYVSFELQDWFLAAADVQGSSDKASAVLRHGSDIDFASQGAVEILAKLDVRLLLRRDVRSLSTGEMRRLLIARALLKSPALLILDEPFGGLDPETRRLTADLIESVAESGTQIILVTNRPDEILPCTTRIACVKDCRIVQLGEASDILNDRTLKELYGFDRVAERSPGQRKGNRRASSRPLVRMKKVTVSYGGRAVLNGIDWTIWRGEHWAVIGPNGAGKSTLLNLITGENLQGYSNEICLFGKRKGTGETLWEIKRRIGAIPTQFLFTYRKDTTAHDAVASGFFDSSGLYRYTQPAQDKKVNKWMNLLGISQLADRPFGQLSFGEKRMIMIARAVVKDPLLLLLDEPCAGLDAANRSRVAELIETIAARARTTIVYVTHHPEELPACITHVLRLDRTGSSYISNLRNSPERGQDAAFRSS